MQTRFDRDAMRLPLPDRATAALEWRVHPSWRDIVRLRTNCIRLEPAGKPPVERKIAARLRGWAAPAGTGPVEREGRRGRGMTVAEPLRLDQLMVQPG
jgi:hypothetical protein